MLVQFYFLRWSESSVQVRSPVVPWRWHRFVSMLAQNLCSISVLGGFCVNMTCAPSASTVFSDFLTPARRIPNSLTRRISLGSVSNLCGTCLFLKSSVTSVLHVIPGGKPEQAGDMERKLVQAPYWENYDFEFDSKLDWRS